MMDLLELLLDCVSDSAFDFFDLAFTWRLFLPLLGALGLVLLIRWTVSNSTVQFVLSAPVALTGLVTGILWQVGKR